MSFWNTWVEAKILEAIRFQKGFVLNSYIRDLKMSIIFNSILKQSWVSKKDICRYAKSPKFIFYMIFLRKLLKDMHHQNEGGNQEKYRLQIKGTVNTL
jgi:hypothetical protein